MQTELKATLLAASIAAGSVQTAQATLIDFNVDPLTAATNVGLNNEVNGSEWIDVGLYLTTPGTFNVGCSSANRGDVSGGCLGVDRDFNDFAGVMAGKFVVPGTLAAASVSFVSFEFCFCTSNSTVSLYGVDGALLDVLAGDFMGQTIAYDFARVSSFSIDFGDMFGSALDSVAFEGAAAVSEPGTLALLCVGLAGLGVASRKKAIAKVRAASP